MANTENSTEVRSISNALEQLFDIAALVECAESQLENDGGNPALRVLRIAHDRIQGTINYLDAMESQ